MANNTMDPIPTRAAEVLNPSTRAANVIKSDMKNLIELGIHSRKSAQSVEYLNIDTHLLSFYTR